jgi:hypothetical protein
VTATASAAINQSHDPIEEIGSMSENITRGLLIGGQEVAAVGGGVTADISPWTGEPYA